MRLAGIVFALVILLAAALVEAGTGFTGGAGEVFTWHQDSKTATGAVYQLGAFYRPDDVENTVAGRGLTKTTVSPANFVFWTSQAIRDGEPDLNFLGIGYSLWKWPSLEILFEGAAVTKTLGAGIYKLGGMAQLDLPFTAAGQHWAFKVGGGYDGEFPILTLGLGFATQ
jgi:hypothetical protein